MNDILDKIDLILNERDDDKIYEAKGDGDEYTKFFNKMLKKYKVKSPDQLSTKKMKEFFDEVEKEWTKEKDHVHK